MPLSHNALKRDAGGKKGKLLCYKCIFDWIKGNLAEIFVHEKSSRSHWVKGFS